MLSNEELQQVFKQLDQAIYNHEQWSKTLFRTLVCRLVPDDRDLSEDAHRQCIFGQWYYGHAPDALRHYESFASIEEAHTQMHTLTAQLLRTTESGNEVCQEQYDSFSNALDRFRLQMMSLKRELQDQMFNRDPLTGAYTRLGMLTRLREYQALLVRTQQPCTLAMLDLDHFKVINDTWGHAAGDTVLTRVAQDIGSRLRPYDLLYRYGGEEFLICLPNTNLEAAGPLVERLREGIEQLSIDHDGHPLSITASFGLAALLTDEPIEKAIDHADAALYTAKAAGRNRVESWSPGMSKQAT